MSCDQVVTTPLAIVKGSVSYNILKEAFGAVFSEIDDDSKYNVISS